MELLELNIKAKKYQPKPLAAAAAVMPIGVMKVQAGKKYITRGGFVVGPYTSSADYNQRFKFPEIGWVDVDGLWLGNLRNHDLVMEWFESYPIYQKWEQGRAVEIKTKFGGPEWKNLQPHKKIVEAGLDPVIWWRSSIVENPSILQYRLKTL